MNNKILQLIFKVIDSDLPKGTRDEIVRWYTLPRNTAVKSLIEIPDNPGLGTAKRPTPHDLKRRKNPKLAETEDAMKETLDIKLKDEKK